MSTPYSCECRKTPDAHCVPDDGRTLHTPAFIHLAGILLLLAGLSCCWQTASAAGEESSRLKRFVERVPMAGERLMMKGVCDQGQIKVRDGVTRCAVCPSYTSSAGDRTGFEITEIIPGAFASGHAQEVLLNMAGCESAADYGGGMILLRRTGTGWSRIQYRKGYRLRDCLKFPLKDERHALFCNQSMLDEDGETGRILWVRATADEFLATPLVRWFDNLNSNPRRLVTVFPTRFGRYDFNKDGRNDVHVLFRVRDETIPENFAGALDAIDAGYELETPRVLGLVYIFDGESLVPDEESRETLVELNALLDKYLRAPAP